VNNYLADFKFEEKDYRIVMVGHSMGGLILRYVAAQIVHPENLYCFISMGSPHLGYLQGIKFFIKAGISFLSSVSSNLCLSELSSKDKTDLHECLIYRLSQNAPLSSFKKLVFLSSVHDKYVSWHSARLEQYNKDPLKQFNFIEHEMINNIMGKQNKIERIDRIEVDFKSLEK
jgi:pimeloyl-ACP methyl ester carboxylesterase